MTQYIDTEGTIYQVLNSGYILNLTTGALMFQLGPAINYYLLQETGDFLLQESGDKIII